MTVLVFIRDLIVATFSQMASLFAGVFIFGLLIHSISRLTFKSLEKAFGNRGVLFVAWLGTPIHELGHALFCIIFLHRIERIEFFEPDPVAGTLGYVTHSWNRHNPWQVLGNFFIGVGPVLLGCGVLFAVFYILIPGSSQVWDAIQAEVNEIGNEFSFSNYFIALGGSSLVMSKKLFTLTNITTWQFWVFIYLSICITSNIRLSLSDIKGAFSGFGCVVLPFLLFNVIGLLAGYGNDKLLHFIASSMGVVYSLFILALIMVGIGFILAYLVAAIVFRTRYKSNLKPY